jgi:hypothetical protein
MNELAAASFLFPQVPPALIKSGEFGEDMMAGREVTAG